MEANVAWKKFELANAGTTRLGKISKIQILVTKFNSLEMKEETFF